LPLFPPRRFSSEPLPFERLALAAKDLPGGAGRQQITPNHHATGAGAVIVFGQLFQNLLNDAGAELVVRDT